ncbi:PAS domain-containing sensor histidine kinase [Cryptosporangium aurantiacum]|uniref:histidine kinase n=1 Tax=Cryptosporangium aurantiacum TaxID=134849 RepID=A0A1M7RN34_9ACTN|nr:PAS domain-containing sensor histidine kinase [Cryptosporangium aurantiacum]SHN47482.1 PAS domain S-box-containing protein [Cryptosporangium aurantiacum]
MATDPVRGECDVPGCTAADGFAPALFDSLQVGVAAFGEDGRLVLANRALRALYQLPADDAGPTDLAVVGRLVRDSLARPDGTVLTAAEHPVERALRGETVEGAEVRITVPEGPPRHAEVNARPIRDADDRCFGAVTAFRDTTGRQRADRFRTCELLVARALAEATTVAEVGQSLARAVAGALGWPHAQLWLVDEVADVLRLVGHWDAPGRTLETVTPLTISRGWGVGGTVWATGEPLWIPDILSDDQVPTSDFAKRARVGATLGVRAVVAVPVRDGRSVLGVLTCVADHREYDGERLVQDLGSIANQVGHFLARRRADDLALELSRVRHDVRALVGQQLRAPLASIVRNSEALAAEDGFRTAHAAVLRALGRDAAAVRALTEDLLDVAALEDGPGGLDLDGIDLVEVVSGAVGALRTQARASGTVLHVGLPEHLPVRGDARRLRSLVDAVIGDAVARSLGGEVYVRLRDEPGVAELTVIDPDVRPWTHHRTPEAPLGLSRSRAIVRAHGGSLAVAHGHHPGTTVTVRLPIGGPPG